MALKDMKLTKKEVKDRKADMPMPEPPKYPYGLSLHLDEESLSKLEVEGVPEAGEEMNIVARAKVDSVGQSEMAEGEKKRHMSLQITHMSVEGGEKDKKAAKRMFGDKKES